ncbi:NBR1-Ig-like domain-containing protein [Trueperella abortisuis]|uniref:NBR1-Ig-like domain-containing protein n=1 Tax=Trueperella abortisuis TaxID=445930 RepID=UPI002893344C|nr:NBR1-Ig-like domain-containing protein [Trueperella abortisuis]
MSLPEFCRAIYKRKSPTTSQAKFVQAVFKNAGSAERLDDEYARKIFSGAKPISEPQFESFPTPVDKESLRVFLLQHLTPDPSTRATLSDRCQEVSEKAGLPSTLTIEPEAFIWALTDWFDAIIHDPDHCDVLEHCYRLRLEGQEPDEINPAPQPLYQGDRVDVTEPPTLQKHRPGFWAEFTHTWTMRNVGSVDWTGRTLVCTNPTDSRLRPVDTISIDIPDSPPATGKFIKISCTFRAQGYEGAASSHWEMHNADGDNCFPQATTTFNVDATVINPDLHSAR